MKRKSLLLGIVFLAAVATACGGGGDDGGPQAGGPPGGGGDCMPSGTVQVTAKNLVFDKNCLAAPANQEFTIEFSNQDPGVPHNVSVFRDRRGGEALVQGEVVTGVTQTTYRGPALEAGTYFFVCEVHPTMNGRFVVA